MQERCIGGLQLYWDIIQDDHFISREISQEATNHLKVGPILLVGSIKYKTSVV
jgi:hypothetical protein